MGIDSHGWAQKCNTCPEFNKKVEKCMMVASSEAPRTWDAVGVDDEEGLKVCTAMNFAFIPEKRFGDVVGTIVRLAARRWEMERSVWR